MVLFLSVLGCDMIARWTWIVHDKLKSGDEKSVYWRILKYNLAISEGLCFCWRILISNIWMLVRNLLLATWCLGNFESNLVSSVGAPPSFPGTLSEIRARERHTWIHPEGRGWNEMKWNHVMLCYHVMSAWVVYGLATWPCLKLEIRRYVYSSHHWPLCWPSTNDDRDGPLLIPFDSGLSTHTHTQSKTCGITVRWLWLIYCDTVSILDGIRSYKHILISSNKYRATRAINHPELSRTFTDGVPVVATVGILRMA